MHQRMLQWESKPISSGCGYGVLDMACCMKGWRASPDKLRMATCNNDRVQVSSPVVAPWLIHLKRQVQVVFEEL